jgi:hypothetical protein
MSWGDDLRLHHQVIGVGNDEHDRLAERHHAADRMNGRLVHGAILRSADEDPVIERFRIASPNMFHR